MELVTGVLNKMGLLNLVVIGQKDDMIRVSISGREQWVGEGDTLQVLNEAWHVDSVNPVASDAKRILEPNKVVAVLSHQ